VQQFWTIPYSGTKDASMSLGLGKDILWKNSGNWSTIDAVTSGCEESHVDLAFMLDFAGTVHQYTTRIHHDYRLLLCCAYLLSDRTNGENADPTLRYCTISLKVWYIHVAGRVLIRFDICSIYVWW
jgi:hypothetical protein